MDLPDECWELICKAIDEDDYRFLEAVSVVSTSFLSITDHVRSTLLITDRTVPLLRRHLLRFRNLKRIKLFDLHSILPKVSLYGLNLESIDVSGMPYFPDFGDWGMKMKKIKEFNCSGVKGFTDTNLLSIALSFPFLEKLDISDLEQSSRSQVSASGIITLSSNLKGLLKINLSGNYFITDACLVSLSRNCLLLREIIYRDCDFISSDCIEFVLRNSPNLESFAINGIGMRPRLSFSNEAFVFARRLSELDLSDSFMSNELLCLIADAKLPLKKLLLSNCHGIDFDGIFYLLTEYQTLVHLNLKGSSFLSDDMMIMHLRKFLGRLTFFNLSFCSKLTGLAFFSIIETCVSLKCLMMEATIFGVEDYSTDLNIKSGIKFLYLSRNRNLRDESLHKVSRHCPFLETLDVAQCPGISRDGICEVLRTCGELRSLDISRCTGIKDLGVVDFELPKLASLRACGTWIDDEALDMISKTCRGLMHLDLKGCVNVKSRGVKDVVQRCIRLREINLKYCEADDGLFTWMVCANPSLRKIVPPCGFTPTKKLKNFLLRHGCLICKDSSELRMKEMVTHCLD